MGTKYVHWTKVQREALRKLKGNGIEALTVSLINAYVNGEHEKRIGEIAAEELPNVPVSLSHEVLPECKNMNALFRQSRTQLSGQWLVNMSQICAKSWRMKE